MVLIIAYIIGYALIWKQGYNLKVEANGLTRLDVSVCVLETRWVFPPTP